MTDDARTDDDCLVPAFKTEAVRCYNDADRLHWYALPADARRGSLADGTAAYAQRSWNAETSTYATAWRPLGSLVCETLAEGIVYYPRFIAEPAETFAQVMDEVAFTQRTRRMYGRTFATPRLEAWHGPHDYTFGGSTLPARELPPSLLSIRIALECFLTGVDFDGCLANLYRAGSDSVGWHADDEPEMGDPIIASVSLGAARDFCFRRKVKTPVTASAMLPNKLKITLASGSLLVMARGVQSAWEHSLPRRARVTEPRINLTYRGQPT